jgi:poly [ADP-ribose] polymerase
MRHFEKKFKDKSGLAWADRGKDPKPGKYAFIERNYEESDDEDSDDENTAGAADKGKKSSHWKPPESKLDPAVQNLMKLIFNQSYFNAAMSSLNYDANKLPLGKLSKATITRGFQALKDLSALIDDSSLAANYNLSYNEAIEHLSNTFYSLIPHAFGRNRPPIIQSQEMVKREIELLESLSDMKDAALIMKLEKADDDVHPLDKQYAGLGMEEMTPLDPESSEFQQLKTYLLETRGYTHGHTYQIENIFRIERKGEFARFDDSEFGKMRQNRRLLWHGSRVTNFGGILSQVGKSPLTPDTRALLTGLSRNRVSELHPRRPQSLDTCSAKVSTWPTWHPSRPTTAARIFRTAQPSSYCAKQSSATLCRS